MSLRSRKQKAAAMAASRWGNTALKDFQCQVGERNVKDAEAQTEISIAPSSHTHKEIPVSPAVTSTGPKPSDVACKTVNCVRTCELVNCASEPVQLQCLDISAINEALEATDLQPLSQDSVDKTTVSKEACNLSLKAALSREVEAHISNAKHTIENLTNGPLETTDGQLLLTTSTSLEKLLKSNLSDLKHCDCEKGEYDFCSLKQNTFEEFEFECSRCGQKVSLASDTSVVKATTCPRSAIRNFVALSYLVCGQYFKDYHKVLGTLGLDHVSSTQWIHIVEWIAPFVKQIVDWSVNEARIEAIQRGDKSSLHIQFDGFYLTRGHYSNNSSATIHDAKTGKIIAYAHRTKRGQGANWEGTSGGAEGDMFGEMLGDLLGTFGIGKCTMDNDSSCQEILLAKSPETEIIICGNHRAKTFHADLQKVKNTPCQVSR